MGDKMYIFLIIVITLFIMSYVYIGFKTAFGIMSIKSYMPHTHLFYYQILAMVVVGSILLNVGIRSDILIRFNVSEESIKLSLVKKK